MDAGLRPPWSRFSVFSLGPSATSQILLIERLAYERFDDSLPADIQFFRGPVQLFKHARGQVNIDSLDRAMHAPPVGEEPGHIFALVRKAGDRFCRHWLAPSTSVRHRVGTPPWLLSRE